MIPRHPLAPRPAGGALVPANRALPMAVVQNDHLVAVLEPDPALVDGFLRLAVRLLVEHERAGVGTVAVMALEPDESRTSTALNLAACLGRARRGEGRVLLVDADVRRRTLSRLLRGNAPHDGTICPTPFDGVDLLCGVDDGGREVLCSPAHWRDVLGPLRSRYAHVVVDGPPLLSDPHALSVREAVEGVVLVLRAGEVTRRTLERATGRGGPPVLGVVLAGSRDPRRGRR